MAEVVVKLESILSQERESTNSVVYDEGFIYKLISFFTGKVDSSIESKSNIYALSKTIADELDAARESNNNQNFKYFTYDELVRATNGFKDKEYSPTLNESIYNGWVDERTYAPTKEGDGLAVYVRKIKILTSKTDVKLEKVRHPDLVKLLGYCLLTQELFCVYDPIPYTSLDKRLYRESGTTSLSWVTRLKIAMGAAEGLFCLHKRNQPAYCQFKTNLILVDRDFNARLSDYVSDSYEFGMDAYYAAPEWFRYQADMLDGPYSLQPEDGFAVKSEIYAFGVVLLEILTGLKVYDGKRPVEKQSLVKWAIPLLGDEVNLGMIMDPQLQHDDDYSPKVAFKLAQLILHCLQPKQDQRPVMEEILLVLHYCYDEETKTV